MGGAVFSPSPLVDGAAVGGAALRCFRLLCGAGFSTLLLFGAACFLPPSGAWCCFLLLPFLWCSFSASPLWVVLLAFSLLFCGAAFLRLLAVLLPFSSKTELNTANTTKDEAKVNLLFFFFVDKLLFHFCLSSIVLLFPFHISVGLLTFGKVYKEGIQI